MKKIFRFLPFLLLSCFLLTGCGDSKDKLVSELMYGVKPGMSMDSVTKFVQNKNLEVSRIVDKAILINSDIDDYLDSYNICNSPTYIYEEDKMTDYYVGVYTASEKDFTEVRFKIESEFGKPSNIDNTPTEEDELYSLGWQDDKYTITMNTYHDDLYYFTLEINFNMV